MSCPTLEQPAWFINGPSLFGWFQAEICPAAYQGIYSICLHWARGMDLMFEVPSNSNILWFQVIFFKEDWGKMDAEKNKLQ